MVLKALYLLVAIASLTITVLSAAIQPSHELLGKRDDDLPARVPYIFPAPGTDPIADAIRARRANGTLLALDGVLLNAPLIASTWNSLFGVIRGNTTIPGNMRELAILRIATLNNASYEWFQHESVGRSEGLTTEQLRVIRLTPVLKDTTETNSILGPLLSAMMTFTDWSTTTARVPDHVFAELRKFLNDQQLVEATATVAGYNFVSRFLLALDVDGKNNVSVPIPT
ncbi:putative glycosidase C21B10.07 [Termitomyces sp. T112]|nr:hypothetical protein C0989_005897 [Termitomyces sp. Mn162]KAG5735639.1 putative glycosidase C21B10.07 [Termitomyces sp. T112]KAH0589414.1 hypothetical protein H2248_005171 [Termitomyces sp. 'cryptogamus']